MPLRLFSTTYCPYAWCTRIVLHEKGIPFEVYEVDLKSKQEDFNRVSPTGKVPVLVDGETRVWESMVINEYLEEKYDGPRLLGETPEERAEVRALILDLNGTRSQPLGDRKAGRSADLDALAAYVASLSQFDISPFRAGSQTVSADAAAGRDLFASQGCGTCHAGTKYSGSGDGTLSDIGTIKSASGSRLYGALTGFDVPTLRDVWATAPYLHDGSALNLDDAIRAHQGPVLTESQVRQLAAFLREMGREEAAATAPVGQGLGLTGRYYNTKDLSGSPVFTRDEAIDFNWGSNAPAPGVNANGFSVRWSGEIEAPVTGTYRLQTVGDDGIRLTADGVLLIDRWVNRSATTDTAAGINLVAGQRIRVVLEYFDNTGQAVARLRWLRPGATSYVAIPAQQLHPD